MRVKISDFVEGDHVRLTKDCQVLHMSETIKAGTTGALGRMYRVQEGVEVWHLRLDRSGYVFMAVAHTDMEKVEI